MKKVSRKRAIAMLLGEHGAAVFGADCYDRDRNYELEDLLEDEFGEEFAITTWCPFDGMWSKSLHYCRMEQIRCAIRRCERLRVQGKWPKYIDYNYHVGHMQQEIRRRAILRGGGGRSGGAGDLAQADRGAGQP